MLGNIFILGDSYSTFKGYIPDGYDTYYEPDAPEYSDVRKVEQTWWYNLTKENGTLLMNNSWSGTTICNTGYNNSDNSKVSFIARIENLLKEGYFEKNKVDTFFLFGGTNDSWSNAPIGEKMHSDWTPADLYKVLPAFSYLINLLTTNFPHTKIYCIINTNLKAEIVEFYKLTCEKNGVHIIELHDIDKVSEHPTIKGMMQIKEQILDYIKSK